MSTHLTISHPFPPRLQNPEPPQSHHGPRSCPPDRCPAPNAGPRDRFRVSVGGGARNRCALQSPRFGSGLLPRVHPWRALFEQESNALPPCHSAGCSASSWPENSMPNPKPDPTPLALPPAHPEQWTAILHQVREARERRIRPIVSWVAHNTLICAVQMSRRDAELIPLHSTDLSCHKVPAPRNLSGISALPNDDTQRHWS